MVFVYRIYLCFDLCLDTIWSNFKLDVACQRIENNSKNNVEKWKRKLINKTDNEGETIVLAYNFLCLI